MTLQERLAEVFPAPHQRGLQATIVRICGVSRPTVSAWFNNAEKVAAISRAHAEMICSHFGLDVSPAWLAEGRGSKTMTAEAAAVQGGIAVAAADELNPDHSSIRVMKLRLKAGVSGFAAEPDEDEAEPIYFRSAWLKHRGFKPYDLVATRVGGHSMEPTLYHDDLVVAHTKDCEPKDGEVFSINYEGEPVIKRLMRDGGEWLLVSDNPDKTRFPTKRWVDGAAIIIGRIVHRQSERI